MRKVTEATPQEVHFCRLRAEGHDQTTAYRIAFDKPDMSTKTANQSASRVAARPQVLLTLREMFLEAKKSQLLSHGQWLSWMIDAFHQSMEEGNKTAAASFGRLMGSGIGALTDNINVTGERMTEEQLLDKLGANDPVLAKHIRRVVNARKSFDA